MRRNGTTSIAEGFRLAFVSSEKRPPLPIVKTLTCAVTNFCAAATVAHLLTGKAAAVLSIGLIEPFVQTFFCNAHERLSGRNKTLPPADIGLAH